MRATGSKISLIVGGVCLLVLCVWFLQDPSSSFNGQKPSDEQLQDNPLYRTYSFDQGERVIDVGVQPLWLPPGIITEVISRDRVLEQDLRELGMTIRFHDFLKGADVNTFLGRGKLEVGIGGDMPALCAVGHHGAQVGAMIQQGFCSIVARTHMLMADLQGKRVGIAYGSNAHYMLMDALAGQDLTLDDITPVYMNVTSMPQALDQKQIDAFAAWEPTPAHSLTAYDHMVIHRGLSTGYIYFASEFYAKHPRAVKLMVASQIRAQRWLRANEQHLQRACEWTMAAGLRLTKKPSELSVQAYMQLAKSDLLGRHGSGGISENDLTNDGRLAKEFAFLQHLAKVPSAVPWSKVRESFADTLVPAILNEIERYRIKKVDYRK